MSTGQGVSVRAMLCALLMLALPLMGCPRSNSTNIERKEYEEFIRELMISIRNDTEMHKQWLSAHEVRSAARWRSLVTEDMTIEWGDENFGGFQKYWVGFAGDGEAFVSIAPNANGDVERVSLLIRPRKEQAGE